MKLAEGLYFIMQLYAQKGLLQIPLCVCMYLCFILLIHIFKKFKNKLLPMELSSTIV